MMIKKSISALILLFGSSNLIADISVEHDKLDYIVAGYRIALEAEIKQDDAPIDIIRTYFKASDEKNFAFVDMQCKKELCSSLLPAPSKETKSIDYLFLMKDEKGKVVKTQTFRVAQKEGETKAPKWQQEKGSEKINIKTELETPPEEVEGFDDDMVIDVIDYGSKYGVSSGITSANSAGTSLSTMSASGVTNGGTVVAGTTGISTTTIVVGSAVAVAGGAGVAVATSSSDDDSDEPDEPSNAINNSSTIDALKGKWDSKSSKIANNWNSINTITDEWSMITNITDGGGCTYTECAYNSCTNGICNVTLSGGTFTFKSDGGAEFSGDIIGATTKFSISGKFANGESGKIHWTKN